MATPGNSETMIHHEWIVGSVSQLLKQKDCLAESIEFCDTIDEQCFKSKISFHPGMKADGTVSHEFVSAFVYIIADIDIEVEAEVDLAIDDEAVIEMENAPVWLIDTRDPSWRGFFYYVKRSKMDFLNESSSIKICCKVQSTGVRSEASAIVAEVNDSSKLRFMKNVKVDGAELPEWLITNDEKDKDFFENKYHSDVTFYANDECIIGHMAILSRRSRFFEALFSHNIVCSQPNNFVFVVDDTLFDEFNDILTYIYTKEIKHKTLTESGFMDWPLVSDLALNNIKVHCSRILIRIINYDNIYDIYTSIASKHCLPELKSFIKDFIAVNEDHFKQEVHYAFDVLDSNDYAELGFAKMEDEAKLEKFDPENYRSV